MNRCDRGIRKANPVKLSCFLNTVVNDLCIGPEITFVELKKNWKEIVGTTNALNTHPVRLNSGILTIAASSPAWLTQARFYKLSFIKKINGFMSREDMVIRDIRFVLKDYIQEF